MCSTPKTHPKPPPTRRYEGMSVDALRRFTDVANAADEKRERRQKHNAERAKSVKKTTQEISLIDRLLQSL